MQEPGAYTGTEIDRSLSYPRPLHCSSRGQPNITNDPGESASVSQFRGAAVLLPMPVRFPAGWFIVSMPSELHA